MNIDLKIDENLIESMGRNPGLVLVAMGVALIVRGEPSVRRQNQPYWTNLSITGAFVIGAGLSLVAIREFRKKA